MGQIVIGSVMVRDILCGLLSLIVMIIGWVAKSQDERIRELERFQRDVMQKWVADAEHYVTKDDFDKLAKELKESLFRIEDKIERLR